MSDPRRLPARYSARLIAGRWYVIDRRTGTRTACADQGAAVERAAVLEGVWRVLGVSSTGHGG